MKYSLFLTSLFVPLLALGQTTPEDSSITIETQIPEFRTTSLPSSFASASRFDDFLRPVVFNQSGLAEFFLTRFNDKTYGNEFLPRCFVHLEDFLRYGVATDHPESFALTTLELFHQRLSAHWVNPFAFIDMLEKSIEILSPLCTQQQTQAMAKEAMKQQLYTALLTQFDQLKEDPETFFSTTVDKMHNAAQQVESVKIYEVQYAFMGFIEKALDKLIWDPRDQEYVWRSVKHLAELLLNASRNNLLPDQRHLNHVQWALINRFCYFLELEGSNLATGCYETIKKDISQNNIALSFEEQEDLMINKKERLISAALEGEIKSRARNLGIISDSPITVR